MFLNVQVINLSVHHTMDKRLANEPIHLGARPTSVLPPYEVSRRGTVEYTQHVSLFHRPTPVAESSGCRGKGAVVPETQQHSFEHGVKGTSFRTHHEEIYVFLLWCRGCPKIVFLLDQRAVFEPDKGQFMSYLLWEDLGGGGVGFHPTF